MSGSPSRLSESEPSSDSHHAITKSALSKESVFASAHPSPQFHLPQSAKSKLSSDSYHTRAKSVLSVEPFSVPDYLPESYPSYQFHPVWKKLESKFAVTDLSKKSLSASSILDLLNEQFSEKELESMIVELRDFVLEIHLIAKHSNLKLPWWYGSEWFPHEIKRFQEKHPQLSFINSNIMSELFILSLIKNEDKNMLTTMLENLFIIYRSLGILFCQTVSDPSAVEKATKILKLGSFEWIKDAVFRCFEDAIRRFGGPIIHMLSACGSQTLKEYYLRHSHSMSDIFLNYIPLKEHDAEALGSAIYQLDDIYRLSLQQCQLSLKFLQTLCLKLKDSEIKIPTLDVSYNEDMTVEGYCALGDLVQQQKVKYLEVRRCSLNFNKLKGFDEHLGNAKIAELDVSGNEGMADEGYCVLGDLVHKREVKRLRMQSCGMNFNKLKAFDEHLGNAKITELDLSENEEIGDNAAVQLLNAMIKKHAVEKLRLESCQITFSAKTEESGIAKIVELDTSWNKDMAEQSFSSLGCLVKDREIKKMRMLSCGLNFNKLNAFNEELGEAKITELDLSENEEIGDNAAVHLLHAMIDKRAVEKLRLESCDITFSAKTEESGIAKVIEIDLSYKKDMTEQSFSSLGCLMRDREVKKVKMWRCGLNFKKLNSFNEGLGHAKIIKLDVSYNEDIADEGFIALGDLVQQREVESLEMQNCGLSFNKLKAFNEHLGDAKISELDVSYNKSMSNEGYVALGTLAQKREVRSLKMRYCELNFNKLRAFDEHLGDAKIIELDVSFNNNMGDKELDCLGIIIEDRGVENFNISCCGLQFDQNFFKTQTGSLKIFSMVSKSIDICGNTISEEFLSHLQKNLHLLNKNNLEVVIASKRFLYSIAGESTQAQNSRKVTEEKIQKPKDSNFFKEIKTVPVDQSEKTVEVGGCFVTFQSGTFIESQFVTITARIDFRGMSAEEDEMITPTLNVDAKNLRKPAKILLHTWCIHDDEREPPIASIWHYSESKKSLEIIHRLPLPESRFFEFQCKEFSPIYATLKRIFAQSYVIEPTVYILKRHFTIALLLDTNLVRAKVKIILEEKLKAKDFRINRFDTLRSKKHEIIKSVITCSKPADGFVFEFQPEYDHIIREVVANGRSSTDKILDSACPHQRDLILKFELFKGKKKIREEPIQHTWEPSASSLSTTEASPPQEDVNAIPSEHLPLEGGELPTRKDIPSEQTPVNVIINAAKVDDVRVHKITGISVEDGGRYYDSGQNSQLHVGSTWQNLSHKNVTARPCDDCAEMPSKSELSDS